MSTNWEGKSIWPWHWSSYRSRRVCGDSPFTATTPSCSWRPRSIQQLRWTWISIPYFLPLATVSPAVFLARYLSSFLLPVGASTWIYYSDWAIVNDKVIFSGRFRRCRNAVICCREIQSEGGKRRLHNEQRHSLPSSPNIIRMTEATGH
jgi:hypothetical protein